MVSEYNSEGHIVISMYPYNLTVSDIAHKHLHEHRHENHHDNGIVSLTSCTEPHSLYAHVSHHKLTRKNHHENDRTMTRPIHAGCASPSAEAGLHGSDGVV